MSWTSQSPNYSHEQVTYCSKQKRSQVETTKGSQIEVIAQVASRKFHQVVEHPNGQEDEKAGIPKGQFCLINTPFGEL